MMELYTHAYEMMMNDVVGLSVAGQYRVRREDEKEHEKKEKEKKSGRYSRMGMQYASEAGSINSSADKEAAQQQQQQQFALLNPEVTQTLGEMSFPRSFEKGSGFSAFISPALYGSSRFKLPQPPPSGSTPSSSSSSSSSGSSAAGVATTPLVFPTAAWYYAQCPSAETVAGLAPLHGDALVLGLFDPNASRAAVARELELIANWARKEEDWLFIKKMGVW